jgi:hypothetical protein
MTKAFIKVGTIPRCHYIHHYRLSTKLVHSLKNFVGCTESNTWKKTGGFADEAFRGGIPEDGIVEIGSCLTW